MNFLRICQLASLHSGRTNLEYLKMKLARLPDHPRDVPWPRENWPKSAFDFSQTQQRLLEELFSDIGPTGTTYALAIIKDGFLIYENYHGELASFTQAPTKVAQDTKLISWSMAKSVLHAVYGILNKNKLITPLDRVPIDNWCSRGDPRATITVDHLLTMRDGLDFREDYTDAGTSDVIEMLFGTGKNDVSNFAISKKILHEPGKHFNYSSGTSNILSRIVAQLVGYGSLYEDFLYKELFEPIGMSSAQVTFDDKGVWVASSYLYASALDFAKFGYLYLRDGIFDNKQILPRGWVDYARTPQAVDPESGYGYGAHWWVNNDRLGTFWASGYEGQIIAVVPLLDLVIVRLGRTTLENKTSVLDWLQAIIASFA